MQGLDGYSIAMIITFVVGYVLITMEHSIKINKATTALLMAIVCWFIQFINPHSNNADNVKELSEHLANISQIVFFLLGALTIVETINAHKGFNIIAGCLKLSKKRSLLFVISLLAFFLSAILDNLTTTIVMISLLRRLVDEEGDRLLIGGAVVIAANAGGAWTPIGDVTTTMLWIGGQISTFAVMQDLFLPSLFCGIAATGILSFYLHGEFAKRPLAAEDEKMEPGGLLIFCLGIALLIFVPVFKILTGLPPFMGILLALGVLWAVTDMMHQKHPEREHLLVTHVLTKIDLAGTVFFFLGILLCINALDTARILAQLALWFDATLGNTNAIAVLIGLASAVVDNVPLVAASMGMYTLEQFQMDHSFWQMIAFCAGTGGSILIIGSAAGVVFMSMERANFFWYLKRISLPALVGYAVGIAVYLLQQGLFSPR